MGIDDNAFHRLSTITTRTNGCFTIRSSAREYQAQRVLLAIGRRGTPRKLGVPGEVSSKVSYRLLEPEQYGGKSVLVIGGGDSAIEAALALAGQKGCTVTLSYRKNAFSRIKEKNEEKIEKAIEDRRINVLFESTVKNIHRENVVINVREGEVSVPNDFVFVLIGGILPTKFLESMGISIEKKFGTR